MKNTIISLSLFLLSFLFLPLWTQDIICAQAPQAMPTNPQGSGPSFLECKFHRDDMANPDESFQSPTLMSYFAEASLKSGVPASLLAGIARVESPSSVQLTDATLSTFSCPTSPTGAKGLMQIQPPGTTGHDPAAITSGAKFLGKTVSDISAAEYCDLKTSIFLASGFVLKKLQYAGYGNGEKWDPAWTSNKDVIHAIARGYYGCLRYPSCANGPHSYGDDLWTSMQNCQNANLNFSLNQSIGPNSSLNVKSNRVCTQVGSPTTPNPCANDSCVDNRSGTSSSGKTVVLDPGHGTSLTDPTAVGASGETERNNKLVRLIKSKLESQGFKVVLTHDGSGLNASDRYDDYQKRIDVANSNNADLFVAVHFNDDSSGPFSLYADRRIISTDGTSTEKNPSIVTPNVDAWVSNSRKANTAITSKLATAINEKYKKNFPLKLEKADHGCEGRACGGHLYVIGPEGQPANPEDGRSIIKKELKAPGAYIETVGMRNEFSNDLELFADGYAAGIKEYFGLPTSMGSSDSQCSSQVAGFVHYCQNDPRWAATCGLSAAGCGPTSIAMILSSFGATCNGAQCTPPEVDKLFQTSGARSCSAGAGSVIPNAINSTWMKGMGVTVGPGLTTGGSLDYALAKRFINEGNIIVASTRNAPSCNCDHIFVLQDVDPTNKTVTVRDPVCGLADGKAFEKQYNYNNISWLYAYPLKPPVTGGINAI